MIPGTNLHWFPSVVSPRYRFKPSSRTAFGFEQTALPRVPRLVDMHTMEMELARVRLVATAASMWGMQRFFENYLQADTVLRGMKKRLLQGRQGAPAAKRGRVGTPAVAAASSSSSASSAAAPKPRMGRSVSVRKTCPPSERQSHFISQFRIETLCGRAEFAVIYFAPQLELGKETASVNLHLDSNVRVSFNLERKVRALVCRCSVRSQKVQVQWLQSSAVGLIFFQVEFDLCTISTVLFFPSLPTVQY